MTTTQPRPVSAEAIRRAMVRANPTYAETWYGATDYFDSTYCRGYAVDSPPGYYFVTGERYDESAPRLYTVRWLDARTGEVTTIGEFQAHATRARALGEARRLAATAK